MLSCALIAMQTYLVRCGYPPGAHAHLLVVATNPGEADAKVRRMPLFRQFAMQIDQVIDARSP